MSYEALARRFRPRQFEDLLGQEHVLRALTNALDHDRLHHAYLFTGTRGVGKTTIARIFAKSLNCEQGVGSSPCGECSACKQVDEGRFLDLIEVDAASRTGVDDTRELLDNVPYAPSSGRYKVYLIDEVHMFSKSSFNALLKTLEEPPPHVKFLLATTDPQRLPITVLSRCLQFNLKELPEQLLKPYLASLLDKEKVKYDELAVAHIAQAADGSVRDALSLLDQSIAYGQGEVIASEVEAMLGRFSPSRLYDLLDAVADEDAEQVFSQIEELASYVPDYSFVLGELLSLLHRVAMLQTIGQKNTGQSIEDAQPGDVHDEQRLQAFAKKILPQDTQLWYQIGLTGRRDMPYAPNQREALEMTLIRMLVFKPLAPNDSYNGSHGNSVPATSQAKHAQTGSSPAVSVSIAADRQSKQSATASKKDTTQAATRANLTKNDASSPQSVSSVQSGHQTPPEKQIEGTQSAAAVKQQTSARQRKAATDLSSAVAGSVAGSVETANVEQPEPELPVADINWSPADWAEVVENIPVSGMPLQLARNCILHSASKDELHLHLDPEYETLAAPRWKERLCEKISVYAQGRVKLKVTIASATPDNTPAGVAKKAEQDRLEAARDSIAQDPVVADIVATFDAKVSTGSIKPVVDTDVDEATEKEDS